MIKYNLLIISIFTVTLYGCNKNLALVKGSLKKRTGNQMPSPDAPLRKDEPLQGTVCFFESALIRNAKAIGLSGQYITVGTALVKEVSTNRSGDFRARLKPGTYSVLIKNDSLFYSNISDGQGFINPVRIEKRKNPKLSLIADWDAAY